MQIETTSATYFSARRRFRVELALFCLACVLVMLANTTAFGQGYQVTDVTPPGARTGTTTPVGVNKNHYVVGYYTDSSGNTVGFLNEAKTYIALTGPTGANGNFARAIGINDSNVVAGDFFGTDNLYHGYTYTAGSYTQIDVDPGHASTSVYGINSLGHLSGSWNPPTMQVNEGFIDVGGAITSFYASGTQPTYAYGINKTDDAVGTYYDSGGNAHGFLRTASTGVITEIKYPGALQTSCFGINDTGEISGTYINSSDLPYGFIYYKGTYTTTDFAGTKGISSNKALTGFYWGVDGTATGYVAVPHTFKLTTVTIPNSKQGRQLAINNSGVSVGTYVDSGGTTHGMMLSGTTVTNIDDPKGVYSICFGINSTNQIVGDYFDTSGNPHGFLYSGGAFTDIPGPPSALSSDATGINDAGDIAGDYFDGGARTHYGFLLKGGNYTTLNPTGSSNTFSGGINASDNVTFFWVDSAGYVQSSLYTYKTKKFSSINVPGAASSYAQSINKTGQIVYAVYDPYGVGHGAVKKGTSYYVFDLPSGSGAVAAGINDLSQFVGSYTPSGQTVPQPFQGK